jgi:hypothetical protein
MLFASLGFYCAKIALTRGGNGVLKGGDSPPSTGTTDATATGWIGHAGVLP